MEQLKNEIRVVIGKLENGIYSEDRIAAHVLAYLKYAEQEMERSGCIGSAGAVFIELRQFWLDSVPWCSEMSRDIEKIIMIYGELADSLPGSSTPC